MTRTFGSYHRCEAPSNLRPVRATIRFVAFTRWDPLRDLLALQERMERLSGHEGAGWTPPVDLYETADAYIVTAELPGLQRHDIDIRFHEGQLTLQGTRPKADVPCERFHRVERGHGTFFRRFALPSLVDVDGIGADLRDGVLTVTVPKASGAGPRRIDVG
jgi:HSP20 family protein